MNFIVVQVCCSSCRMFEDLKIINCENYLDLKQILKDLSNETGSIYYVYNMEGLHIDTLFFDID